MRSRLGTGLLVLLVATLSASVTAQDEALDEEMVSLRKQVAGELAKVPRFPGPFDHLEFSISGSVVTLTGFATSPSLKADAQKRVERIDWVTEVVNEIEFHQSEPAANQIREETLAILTEALPDAFSEMYPDIKIKVDPELNVTLVGRLSPVNRGRLESALVRIDQLALVKSVENQVEYKSAR